MWVPFPSAAFYARAWRWSAFAVVSLTSSPLAQYPTGSTGWEKHVNSFRISETYAKDNFGLVEIDWDTKPSPLITLKLIGVDGSIVLDHKISLDIL